MSQPRLTTPLVREHGVLRPASWEEALTRAADGFARARAKDPRSFGLFSCSKATNSVFADGNTSSTGSP